MATRVILVRHGESTYNAQRRVQGHCDESTLTDLGRHGATQVGVMLRGLVFDAAYSSPLKRAHETAKLILENWAEADRPIPALSVTPDLKEISLPLWEGLTFADVEARYPTEFAQWRDRPHELCMQVPNSETTAEFYPVPALYEQAQRFWREILPQHPNQTILVVAHSGINRCLINQAIGLGPEAYQTLYQSNCGISVLNFNSTLGDQVQIESVNLTAHVGAPLPKPRLGQGGVRLLLVRHGETDWNRDKRFQGQIDVPLNDQGRQQAKEAAIFLEPVAIDRAVSSPMLRPKETAEIILQRHPEVSLELEPELCEISHGLWEGKFEGEIEQAYPGLLKQWQQSPETVQMPEGENLQQVWDRAVAAWQQIVATTPLGTDRPTTVLVVAHDAVNKAILAFVTGKGPDAFWTFKQGNGAVSVIDYPRGLDGPPMVQALNITSHLGGVLDKTAAGAL